MQLSLIAIGATSQPWVKDGVEMYNKRLSRYTKYQYIETPNLKGKHAKADPARMMKEEAAVADKHLQGVDHLILLDEHGPQMGSIQLSKHLQGLMNRGLRHTAFLIGGPYGFDPSLRAQGTRHLVPEQAHLPTRAHPHLRRRTAVPRAHHSQRRAVPPSLKPETTPKRNNATRGSRCLRCDVMSTYSASTVTTLLSTSTLPPLTSNVCSPPSARTST